MSGWINYIWEMIIVSLAVETKKAIKYVKKTIAEGAEYVKDKTMSIIERLRNALGCRSNEELLDRVKNTDIEKLLKSQVSDVFELYETNGKDKVMGIDPNHFSHLHLAIERF